MHPYRTRSRFGFGLRTALSQEFLVRSVGVHSRTIPFGNLPIRTIGHHRLEKRPFPARTGFYGVNKTSVVPQTAISVRARSYVDAAVLPEAVIPLEFFHGHIQILRDTGQFFPGNKDTAFSFTASTAHLTFKRLQFQELRSKISKHDDPALPWPSSKLSHGRRKLHGWMSIVQNVAALAAAGVSPEVTGFLKYCPIYANRMYHAYVPLFKRFAPRGHCIFLRMDDNESEIAL